MITICPRCRAPHDAYRNAAEPADPLLLTGAARLCPSCTPAPVAVITLEDLATQHDLAA